MDEMTSAESTSNNGTEPDSNPATWIPGVMLADALEEQPDAAVRESLPADSWSTLRRFGRRFGVPITSETLFEELDAVPAAVAHTCGLDFTRREVSEFVADYAYPLPDPHGIGAQLVADRSKRFRDTDRVEKQLKPKGIPAATEYALSEVERTCGTDTADAARRMIEQRNGDTWNMGTAARKHRRDEHPYLVTAAELVSPTLGVPVETVATMTPATADEISAAWADLADARAMHHAGGKPVQKPVSRRWLTADDLDNLPAPGYLVDKLLPTNSLVRISGMSETLKSFIAFDMALSIATGTPFLGHARFGTSEPAHVLYVVGEGAHGVRKRIRAWCQRRGVSYAKVRRNLTILHGAAQFASRRDMADVAAKAGETDAVLAVFDTQARCTVGLEEDNATAQGQAIARITDLIADTGMTVLVLHHTPKRDPRTARGSVAWTNAADAEMIAVRDGKELAVTLEVTKMKDDDNTGVYPIRAVKVDTPYGESLVLEPGADPLSVDPDQPMNEWTGKGSAYAAAMYALAQEHCIAGEGLTQSRLAAIAHVVVGTETTNTGKARDVRRVCHENTATAAVKLLVEHGKLVEAKRDPLGHVFYQPDEYPPSDPAVMDALMGNADAQPAA